MNKKSKVVGIGEILWDVFPDHKRLGGAPTNFAFHAHQLGADAWPVSSIGSDALGQEVLQQLISLGMESTYVNVSERHPTGVVEVILNAGKPSYQIHENVAWDHIPFTEALRELAESLDAVCFGSLAQRSEESRETIQSFLSHVRADAIKIFDINLRQAFYNRALIEESLEQANILKLSDEELPTLAEYFALEGMVEEQLRKLLQMFTLRMVAFTRGAEGSLLVTPEGKDDFAGCECQVVDSVGAGDSFTASLCTGLLKGWPLNEVNAFANQVAAFVCSQKGATPILPDNLVNFRN